MGFLDGDSKVDDDADDRTIATLPDRPCQRCFAEMWSPPHSIGRDCIEQARGARLLREQRELS
jgi:hypothetical protein